MASEPAYAAAAEWADAAGGCERRPEDPRFAALLTCAPPAGTEAFVPGKSATVTPGQVVFRRRLTTRRIPDAEQRPGTTPRDVAGETSAAATGDL